jgi:hypothetical protein
MTEQSEGIGSTAFTIRHGIYPAPVTDSIIANDTGDSSLIANLAQHARKCEAQVGFYQHRQEHINEVRRYLAKLIEVAKSHNDAAKKLGWGVIPEHLLDDAVEASDKLDEVFLSNTSVSGPHPSGDSTSTKSVQG